MESGLGSADVEKWRRGSVQGGGASFGRKSACSMRFRQATSDTGLLRVARQARERCQPGGEVFTLLSR